jgi:Flp pilus assembly protein TadG
MKFQSRTASRKPTKRGAAAVYVLITLVPVLFALIGFAVDLGILYSVKGELKAGATSMALAAAQQLIGTDTATDAATTAAQLTIENSSGFGNKYYFHGLPIGQNTGAVVSTVSDPAYFATAADAIASGSSPVDGVAGSAARYVRVTLTGQTQLLFWSFLPIVSDRNVSVLATAVAGISAPLCQACGIEPFAVAALNPTDTTDFGFTVATKYSLTYLCNVVGGAGQPAVLSGASRSISYVLLNRLDPNATVFADEASQAFRDGAGGVPGSTDTAQACFRINNTEAIWPSAVVNACNVIVAPVITSAMCGLDTRFESTSPAACAGVPGIDTLSTIYQPDTDATDHDAYTDYTGNGRRVITIPIVDTIGGAANMTVLGFRQFLVIPNQGALSINPADQFGRFIAMYIGSVVPLKQGRFDGCQQTAGPGKVVLHQ